MATVKEVFFIIAFLVFIISVLGYAVMDAFPFPANSTLCRFRNPYIFIPRLDTDCNMKCLDYWITRLNTTTGEEHGTE